MRSERRHWGRCLSGALLTLVAGASAARAQDRELGPPLSIRAGLTAPGGLAFDAARQRVFVADTGAHRIRYFDLPLTSGSPATRELGYHPDRRAPEALAAPQALAVDPSGHLYVVDTFQNEVELFRHDPVDDSYRRDATFAAESRRVVDGVAIQLPRGIAVSAEGRVHLLDSGNRRVLVAEGPTARRWNVWHTNSAWRNPYGIAVGSDGAVWVADTDNHRLVRIEPGGRETTFGALGTGPVQFRHPRGVAIAGGGRVFVADTHNHRVQILSPEGTYVRQLGAGRLFDGVDDIAASADGRVFALDRIAARVIAHLGPSEASPLDAYIRDREGDDGSEPSGAVPEMASPDILLRYQPDVDLALAAREGLASYGSDTPLYGRDVYVYLGLQNRGRFDFPPSVARLYTLAATGPHHFPDRWSAGGFFEVQADGGPRRPSNLLLVPSIPARGEGGGEVGRVVVGPLLLRLLAPAPSVCDGVERIAARLVSLHDPTPVAEGLQILPLSNNVAALAISAVSPGCIPDPDRYEPNDNVHAFASVTERWQHLHRRCPPHSTRDGRRPGYPERVCLGVFENFHRPGDAPAAQDIWTMVVPDLSLHSPSDRDFLEIPLPDPGAAEYGNHDIRSTEERLRSPQAAEPMPECGVVRRRDLGPRGLDNTVHVSISTRLTITVEPTGRPDNAVALRPVSLAGEALQLYRGVERDDSGWAGPAFEKTIDCPRSQHSVARVRLSFGERATLRALAATGGYQLRLTYLTDITRGIPAWAEELGPGRPPRGLVCQPRVAGPVGPGLGLPAGALGILPQFAFPFCLGLGDRFLGNFSHPSRLGVPGCIADGPGCWEHFLVSWPGGQQGLDVVLRSGSPLKMELLGPKREVFAASAPLGRALKQLAPKTFGLRVPPLPEGVYVLRIEGKPTSYELEFVPPKPSFAHEHIEPPLIERKKP